MGVSRVSCSPLDESHPEDIGDVYPAATPEPMAKGAAKGSALWPVLLATAATRLAGPAQASIPSTTASCELLSKPALTAALASAELV